MLYHLSHALHEHHHVFNLLRYVSVRSIAALLSALVWAFLFGNLFIRASRRYFRSKVRDWTPQAHQKKNDTPTMGGLFILSIFLVNTLLWNKLTRPEVWIYLGGVVGFGAIGCVDDWRKINRSKGITARQKIFLQIIVAATVIGAWVMWCNPDLRLCVPVFKNLNPYLGWLIVPWGIFVIIAMSNAVNLTDGLDGLAAGPLMFNFSAFSVIAYLAGHRYFAEYLHIPYAGSSELSVCGATLIGALLGFLWYNTYPAQIFMGDVGSLALGAALGMMGIMTRQELLLVVAGGIFVVETLSVILQVASFKLCGRRIFRMAPIHHHFELLGWNEAKITVRFWIVSIILSLITLLLVKIR